jgi:hypothetical protein
MVKGEEGRRRGGEMGVKNELRSAVEHIMILAEVSRGHHFVPFSQSDRNAMQSNNVAPRLTFSIHSLHPMLTGQISDGLGCLSDVATITSLRRWESPLEVNRATS